MATAPATNFVKGVHGIRYQSKDVARAAAFYTTHLGFTLKHQQFPAFANVSLGDVDILLSGPQASGSRPLPDGRQQSPGGWNRIVLRVSDLPACIDTLKKRVCPFGTRCSQGRAGGKSRLRIPTATPSSCSSRRHDDAQELASGRALHRWPRGTPAGS